MKQKCLKLYWLLILFLAAASPAGETDPLASLANIPDSFLPGSGKPPRAGDWLEYRIAFPIDALERNLSPGLAPVPPEEGSAPSPAPEEENQGDWESAFNPPISWRSLPLRLEIIRVEGDNCRLRIVFAGLAREMDQSLALLPNPPAFFYSPPQPPDAKVIHRAGRLSLEGIKTSRREPGRGFVRISSPEIPFGLLRFATEDLDLVLVGAGRGLSPSFPLPDGDKIDPPLGRLYEE
ncbi:MAG: hypothetical protein LBU64_09045 [Planctomycetota bacterium]|nr:hypothetical protein [Planctomycetota bacterium]